MTPIDFILGKDIQTGQVVTTPHTERFRGTYIIGRAGSGKTHFMETLIVRDIQEGYGTCAIDPHGDMIQNILARIPNNRVSDVVLLDPLDPDYAFGLNMFETDPGNTEAVTLAVSYVLEMFAKLFTRSGDFCKKPPIWQER